jgi:antitoxin (DNA-binding transcriptional repressor) of toxin-antitoxin stability system
MRRRQKTRKFGFADAECWLAAIAFVKQNRFTMTTVSIRDLRQSFPKIEALLTSGEEVWITRRGKAFACITPRTPPQEKKPDFKARFGPKAEWKPVRTRSATPVSDFIRWRAEER